MEGIIRTLNVSVNLLDVFKFVHKYVNATVNSPGTIQVKATSSPIIGAVLLIVTSTSRRAKIEKNNNNNYRIFAKELEPYEERYFTPKNNKQIKQTEESK